MALTVPSINSIPMDLIGYVQDMYLLAAQGEKQGILFWVVVYTFIVSLYSLIFQVRTRYWPYTLGQLSRLAVDKFGGPENTAAGQNYMGRALYRYDVGGESYEGSRVSPWVIVASHNAKFLLEKQLSRVQQYPDGKVRVFYNPNKPQKSYLIVAGKAGIVFTVLLVVVPPLAYFFSYAG